MNQITLQMLMGAVMVIGNIIFHVGFLIAVTRWIKKFESRLNFLSEIAKAFVVVVMISLFVLLAHIIGIWIWAVIFMSVDIFSALEPALYFSTITSTTVGYGDLVLEDNWRLLGSFQGMCGIILFGISTAFLIAAFRRAFFHDLTE